jgi:hypothetical protein
LICVVYMAINHLALTTRDFINSVFLYKKFSLIYLIL